MKQRLLTKLAMTPLRIITILSMLLALLAPFTQIDSALAAAALTVSPSAGPIGSTVTVTGSGFGKNDTITIKLGTTTVTTSPSTCKGSSGNPGGDFTCTFVVPTGTTLGATTVSATDQTPTTVSQSFTVISPTTTLTVQSATGTFGGTVNLSATLTSAAGALSGRTINFTLNGTSVGSGTTDASGIATLSNASLASINAGTYATGVGASFSANSGYNASSATNTLTVNKASQTITFNALANRVYGEPAFTVSATASSGLTVSFAASGSCTISGTSVTVTTPGTCTITASQAGNSNYNAATNVAQSFTVNKANTTTTVPSTTAAVGDASVTLTANVAASSPSSATVNEGSVTFTVKSGATTVGTLGPINVTSGSASGSFSLSGVGAGTYDVNTTYSPATTAPNFNTSSTTGTGALTVGKRSTTTSVSCSPNPDVVGVVTTCTVTVTDSSNGNKSVPTGTVNFSTSGGGTFSGAPCTLTDAGTGSSATCQVTYTPSTTTTPQTITANYNGDTNHSTSSNTTSLVVQGKHATATAISCVSPADKNVATTCTATVTDTNGSPVTPTGTVSNWRITNNVSGTFNPTSCTLSPTGTTGVASCTVQFTPTSVGSTSQDNLAADYGGDTAHNTSSGTFTLFVRSVVTVAVSCNPSSLVVGSPTTCTVTIRVVEGNTSGSLTTGTLVTWTTNPTNSGTFSAGTTGTFNAGPPPSCAVVASGNSATCNITFTPSADGSVVLTANYAGNSGSAPNSGTATLGVNRSSSTSVSCTPNPDVVNGPITCTATVSDTSSGNGVTPTGTVTWSAGGPGSFSAAAGSTFSAGPPPSCTLSNGSCSVTFTPTITGLYVITANYTGDSKHNTSSGNTQVTVTGRTTSTSITCSPSPDLYGAPTTCTATVTDTSTNGAASTPTGTVNWVSSGTDTFSAAGSTFSAGPPPSCTLSNGSCSVTYTPGNVGTFTITGGYNGDSLHAASTGNTSLTVNPANTTTSVSNASVLYGASSVTLNATVTVNSPSTGTVNQGSVLFTVKDSQNATVGNPVLVGITNGSASTSYALPAGQATGSYTIQADYIPFPFQPLFNASTGTGTLTINKRSTTTSVSCVPSTVSLNNSTDCTVTVTDNASGTAATPTGTVSFSSTGTGSFNNSTCSLSGTGASASCTVTYTAATFGTGSETITATYGGSTVHLGSSGTATLTLNRAPTATVALSPTSPTTNQTLTATATKADADGDTVTLTFVWKKTTGNQTSIVKTTPASTSLTDTLDLSVAGNGDKGDVITVEVTPNDGKINGATATDQVTVANSTPVAQNGATSVAHRSTTGVTVTLNASDADADNLTYSLVGTNGGAQHGTVTITGNSALYVPSGDYVGSDSFQFSASDGVAGSNNATVTIDLTNSAPTVTVSLSPSNPQKGEDITSTATPADADGDSVSLSYVWKLNGTIVPGQTTSVYTGNKVRGDVVSVEVTPNDGHVSGQPATAQVTVANTPPSAIVTLNPTNPKVTDSIKATPTGSDADGDTVTFSYVWKRGGTVVTGQITDTYSGGQAKGDTITVEVTPNDGFVNGAVATASVTIGNSAPVASDSTATVGHRSTAGVDITLTATDADNDSLTYSLVGTNGGALHGTVSLTGSIAHYTPNPSEDFVGNDSFQFKANDTLADSNTATITVSLTNSAPTASVTLSPTSPRKLDTITANATSADADGDTVTFSYVWKRNNLVVDGQTTSTYSGPQAKGDIIVVEVTPFDGHVNGALASAQVTVANTAPTASVTLSPTSPKVADTITANPTGSDVDGDTVTFSYVWKRNNVVVPNQTSSTYNGGQAKGDTITVEVTPSDGTDSGAIATASVTIANTAPVAQDGTATVGHRSATGVDITLVATDADGDGLIYALVGTDGGAARGTVTLSGNIAHYTPTGDFVGPDTFQFNASDGSSTSNSATITVTLTNSAPTATVTLNPTSPKKADNITASVITSDADGDSVTVSYVWKRNGTAVSGQTSSTYTDDKVRGDVIRVEVTPNDGHTDGAVASAEVTVVNTPPTATVTLSPSSPKVADTIKATPTGADDDGDSVSFSYVWKRNGITVANQSTDTYSGGQAKGDTITVEVTPNDGFVNGAVATASLTIGNTAPIANNGTATVPHRSATGVSITLTASDADNDILSYNLVGANGGALHGTLTLNGNIVQYVPNAAADFVGNDTFQFTASDNLDNSAPATINVSLTNSAPTASVTLSPTSPRKLDSISAAVTTADDDGDTVTVSYVWKRNNTTVDGQTTSTYSGPQAKGDIIAVEVTPFDGHVNGALASAQVTVVNTPPTATVTLSPTSPKIADTISASATGADVDGDTVTFSYAWKRNGNIVTGQTTSTYNGGQAKGDTITVEVTPSDGTDSGAIATASVTIANTAPVAQDGTATVGHRSATGVDITLVATDADGDGLTYSLVGTNGGALHGTVAITANTVHYTPNAADDFVSPDTFQFSASDGSSTSNSATITVTLTNSAPTATVTLNPTSPKKLDSISASVTTADADSDNVTVSYVWKHNSVVVSGQTTSTYSGPQARGDVIRVEVTPNDGHVNGAVASAEVTVVNTPPTASVVLSPITPKVADTISASPTGSDVDGDTVTFSYVWKRNDLVVTGQTTSTYSGGQAKGDKITVEVTPNDGFENGAIATASVTIANTAPVAQNGTASVAHRSSAGVDITLVATDADNDSLNYSLVGTNGGAAHGTVTITGSTAHYTPNAADDFMGDDTFQFKASDTLADSNNAIVTVTLTNSAPTATVSLSPTTPKKLDTITATATSADADGDTVSLTYVWKHNGVVVTGQTTSTYSGPQSKGDSIQVEVTPNDGHTSGAVATATVIIGNTAPVASNGSISVAHRSSAGADVTLVASDVDSGDVLGYTLVDPNGGAQHGTVTITGNTAHYTPTGDYVGSDSFQFKVNDGTEDSNTATISVDLTNSAPTVSVSLSPSNPKQSDAISASVITADADGDTVTVSYVWKRNSLVVANQTTSAYTGGQAKGDTITVEVTPNDGHVNGLTATASVTIANTAPVSQDGTATVAHRSATGVAITLVATDADGDNLTYNLVGTNGGASHGTITISGNSAQYVPTGDYVGSDSFQFTATDGSSTSNTATVTVSLTNSAPTATVSLSPTSPKIADSIKATPVGTDADGDTVTFSYVWKRGATVVADQTTDTYTGPKIKGDVISVEATPFDGHITGTAASAQVTVVNTPPTASVSLIPTSPKVGDSIKATPVGTDADGDTVTFSYVWKRGSTVVPNQTTDTYSGGQAKGETITVEVTPNDGTDSGSVATASVTIGNTAPVASNGSTSVAHRSSTGVDVTLVATDADNIDNLVYSLVGLNGGAQHGTVTISNNSNVAHYVPTGDFVGSDSFQFKVNDGSEDSNTATITVTLTNSAPSVTVTLSPANPKKADSITATATPLDADGDTVTLSYIWKRNNSVVPGESASTYTGPQAKGDVIRVEVTPNDGHVNGQTASAEVTLANTPPTASVTLSPISPKLSDVISASATGSDVDGDTVTLTYAWKRNNILVSGQTSSTYSGGQAKGDIITVEVTPSDGTDSGAVATASVTIGNTAPVATASTASVAHRSTTGINIPLNATDADNDGLTFSLVGANGGAAHGTITISANNALYIPTGDFVGIDTFQFKVNDGLVDSNTATVTVTLTNSAPTANVTLSPASPKKLDSITASVTTTDVDGDTVTVSYVWKNNNVVVSGQTGSSYTGPQAKGDTITVEVTPNDGHTDGVIASTQVTVVNTSPTASVTLSPTSPKVTDTISASASGADVDGDNVTLSYVWKRNGTTVDGQTTSTYSGGQAKGDTITVEVTPNDGSVNGSAATASVVIGNTAPVAQDGISSVAHRSTTGVDITLVATDADGDLLSYALVGTNGGAVHGTVSITGNTAHYVPTADFVGIDTFQFKASDGALDSNTASIALSLTNSAPSVTVSLSPSSPKVGDTITATATTTDADGDAVSLSFVWKRNGNIVVGQNTSAYSGGQAKGDVIRVEVTPNDGHINGSMAFAEVTVVNTPPTATVSLSPSNPKITDTISATASGADDDGDTVTLTYAWKRNNIPVGGQTSSTYSGGLAKGDTITVEVTPSDGTDSGAVATASVTVGNTAPVASNGSASVAHRSSTGVDITLVATDTDGDNLTYNLVGTNGGATHGSLTISGSTAHYTPTGDYVGTDSFQFTATDGSSTSNTATITVSLTNSAPTATVSLSPASPKVADSIVATASGSDGDGDTVTLSYVWKRNGTTVSGQTTSSYSGGQASGDSITVEVTPNDGHIDGAAATAQVTIGNTAPVASNSTATVGHRSSTGVDITLVATDADNNVLTYSLIGANGGALHGTVSSTGNTAHYTPTGDYVGSDSFQFKANDGTADSNTATVTVTLTNAAPTATVSLSPTSPKVTDTITATASGSDTDGDTVTLTYIWKRNGTVVPGQTSSTYNGGQASGDTITVEVTPNDGHVNGTVATAQVTFGNTAPVAQNGTATVAHRSSTGVDVTLVATDADGNTLTYSLVGTNGGAAHGTVSITGNTAHYTPNAVDDFVGTDSFQFKANDGTTDSNTATITVSLTNSAPTASVSLSPASPKKLDSISANATSADADGDTVSLSYVWKRNGTTVSGQTTSSYSGGQAKGDTITVEVTPNDGHVSGTVATAQVTVVNTPPTASVTLSPSSPKATDTITANATGSDVDGDTVTLSYAWRRNGNLVSGQTTSTYSGGQASGDTIAVEVTPNDGSVNGTVATAQVVVGSSNTAPVAQNGTASVGHRSSTGVDVTLVATDVDGNTLTYSLVGTNGGAAHGTVTRSGNVAHYTPTEDFVGTDTFQFKANDGLVDSNTATITVTLTNAAPTATVTLSPANPKKNDTITANATGSDADGDTVTFTYVWRRNGNPVTGQTTKTYSGPQNNGDVIKVEVTPNDGHVNGTVATAQVVVGSSNTNAAPVANNQTVATNEDTAKVITLTASDTDSPSLTFSIVSQPANGTLGNLGTPTCTPSGAGANCTATVTYTPAPNFNGTDSFTFKVNDGTSDSKTATVTITVNPVNDAPVANNQSVTTTAGTAKAITLAASDIDSTSLTFSIVSQPAHGTLGSLGKVNCSKSGAGSSCTVSVTYTPAAGYSGPDSFTFKANDGSLDSNTATVTITVQAGAVDTTPPTVIATQSVAANAAGWNKADVQVTLTATDNAGGSGVKEITYSATGAQPLASTTVPGASATLPLITTEGVTTITYFAKDNAGNVSTNKTLTIRLDKTGPTITLTTPVNGATYKVKQKVTADYTCSDTGGSGIASCTGTVANGKNIDTSKAGTYTFTVTAVDVAGNTTTRSVTYTVTN
jgi:hypothetical protein